MKQINNNVPVEQVFVNGNIRTDNNSEQFNALKESIKTVGQIVPVTAFEENGKYCILTGHQRLKALQELGYKNILLQVVPKPKPKDHSLHQYHENMFRVEMSLYDQVEGLRKIALENPKITYAQLSSRFGKDVKWVGSRMKLANLIKPLYTKEIIVEESFDDLVEIGSYSQAKQTLAYKSSEGNIWHICVNLRSSSPTHSQMSELFDQSTIDEYWSSYKKKKKAKSLFDESSIQWDWDFVEYCLKKDYADRLDLLYQIPMKPLEGWDALHQRPDWTLLFSQEDKKIAQIIAWNGCLGELVVKVKTTASANTSLNMNSEPKERSRFQGCGTKLARAVTPSYHEYVMKGLHYEDNVVEWLREVGEYRFSLSNISTALHKDLLPNFGINEIGKLMFEEYVSDSIEECTIGELSMLANISGKLSVTDWINDVFVLAETTNLRAEILKSFKTIDLQKAYNPKSKTKTAIIDELKDSVNKFKFNGIFKDKDANFWDQKCKTFLKTEDN